MSNQAENVGLPLSADYPAAHSMDTTWYAVDLDGHVAVFATGEGGHAPLSRYQGQFLDSLFLATSGDVPVEGEVEYRYGQELASEIGLFAYDYPYSHDLVETYSRVSAPTNPLHVDQLLPELRNGCKQVRFPIRFAEMNWLQPIEHFECEFWYGENVCYVLSDGKTVRPFPGKEHEFAEFVRQYRENNPNGFAAHVFEGLDHGN